LSGSGSTTLAQRSDPELSKRAEADLELSEDCVKISLCCSASRELRNKAEKLRRDRLNRLIEEMKQLVPVISAK
jgi:adenylylsulfate kinase-like enzyme